jgi:hypothetical protein
MTRETLNRLAALGLTGCLSFLGCDSRAPRRLMIPADIRPISGESLRGGYIDESREARVQFEQPPPQPGGRITSVSAGSEALSESIREPNAAAIGFATAGAASPRSEFIPIAMPDPTHQPTMAPVPPFPSRPMFESTLVVGPQLIAPTVPAGERASGVGNQQRVAGNQKSDARDWKEIGATQHSSLASSYTSVIQPAGRESKWPRKHRIWPIGECCTRPGLSFGRRWS